MLRLITTMLELSNIPSCIGLFGISAVLPRKHLNYKVYYSLYYLMLHSKKRYILFNGIVIGLCICYFLGSV